MNMMTTSKGKQGGTKPDIRSG